MIRAFDVLLAILVLICAWPLLALIWLLCLFDTGAPVFSQQRVGLRQMPFVLYKFRTMRPDAPQVATHEADDRMVTTFGHFLRSTKLDELPQLWNVLKGEMSLVGPRPCLPSQAELIAWRARLGVFAARPGVTGLAQVSDIDMSTPQLLAETDAKMLADFDIAAYFRYILMTATGRGIGDRVKPYPK